MIRKLSAAVVCLLALCVTTSPQAQTFTLPQVMSGPFSSHLQPAPRGSQVVWIADQQGRRNLWIADTAKPATSARQLTAYTADDGQDLGDIVWTPDAHSVIYVRGGDFEFPAKGLPNPALLTAGVDQTIYLIPAAGGQPRKLAEGRAPAISPDGKTLVFLDKDQLWTLPLSAPANTKPTVLLHAHGTLGAPRWSPDGKYIAFTSVRTDHGFIGVYSCATQSIHYLSPGTEMDRDFVWSLDSTRLAFIRIPPDTSSIDFKPRRTAQPWSILVADAATGEGHVLWTAAEGPGSVFHPLASEETLFWTAANHLIFPWEQTGWTHLYEIPLNGGQPELLTPGDFEVEHASLSDDRATLVFSSNQNDIDRRHIWQLSPDAPTHAPTQLTKGDGIEVFPAITATNSVVTLRSDARLPMHPAALASGDLKDLAPQLIPRDFPAASLVVPQPVIFPAADGLPIHGQLFLPPTLNDGHPHPALVFFHGGSRRQMLLGWHYMGYYSNAYAMNQYLASLGYIVLSANYRSGIGYGLNFREALNYGAGGASEFNDVMGAGLYLRSRPDVDPARIGAWGGSYGGYLTALALARASDLFAAGVDFHGVHDWNITIHNFQPTYDPADDPNAARLAWESSPLASVKTWRSPVLLIQGDDDRNVPFSNTVRLAAALRAQGVPFEQRIFPDEIHAFLLHSSWVESYTLTADFFHRHLQPKP